MELAQPLGILKNKFEGSLHLDRLHTAIYATDASVYSIKPLAVAYPKSINDLQLLIQFANQYKVGLILRTAGTSLAGQCVGSGIVVDVSKHFTKILNFNQKKKTVTVQPGVVRDELNLFLKPYGLFFSPNTSTSNRCMIGGMVGNNSSGTTSIKYGVTRDKVLALKTLLSDGSFAEFKNISFTEINEKLKEHTLEANIYKILIQKLSTKDVKEEILNHFPKINIHRRNTGYALDELVQSSYFNSEQGNLNLCQLLTGSEGTLAITTEITLNLDPLPPTQTMLVALHFKSINNCMQTVKHSMNYNLYSCEMMDKTILDCTKRNKAQLENRRFIKGDPEAILMCEFKAETLQDVELQVQQFLTDKNVIKLSYHHAVLINEDINKAFELRKAGLGLLGNMVGDYKAVACIEDTAVALDDLANYIQDFSKLMEKYQQKPVYYAHAGAGELHLRPILNLKKENDVLKFKQITTEVAQLVKSYNGSFSGEHGDGIVRASYIPFMIGEANYQLLKEVKHTFDPNNILNPGKIIDALPMDKNLRYVPGRTEPEIKTFIDFSSSEGILKEAEKCNGSGDCRKTEAFGGVMCPSYRATKNEKDTTRARANALRTFLTESNKANKFNHKELHDVFKLCLSCKACATECPSSVDVAALKAEFLYQYKKENGSSLRTKLFANNHKINQKTQAFSKLSNLFFSNKITSPFVKNILGIAIERSLPLYSIKTLEKEYKTIEKQLVKTNYIKEVFLFNDEFTNFYDSHIGLDCINLLTRLNYKVTLVKNFESGRALISKGFLEEAKQVADKNISLFKNIITHQTPLLGIEPSAILTFKDEYLKISSDVASAQKISNNTFLIEEFIANEISLGHITINQFTKEEKNNKTTFTLLPKSTCKSNTFV